MKLAILFAFSLIVRLIIILLSKGVNNYDLRSYFLIGEKTLNLINIYPQIAINHHPYFPLFLYLEALAFKVSQLLDIDFIYLIKIIINIFDLGSAFLLYKLSSNNIHKLTLYLFNPITILIFSFHGQFDAIPLLFLLLTLYLLKQKKIFLSSLTYSLSVTIKSWPIFFIFILIPKIRKFLFIISLPLILILFSSIYSFFYKTNLMTIFQTIISYRSLFSEWGLGKIIKISFYSYLSQPPIFIQKLLLAIFIICLFSYSFFIKKFFKKNNTEKIYLLLLFFYVFTFGFSIQYLSWIVPFLIISKTKKILTMITILIITFYLIINYLDWINPSFISPLLKDYFGITLWLYFSILWLLKNTELLKKPKY